LIATTLAATFKNSDISVQSPATARSLLFEQHRGDSAALMLGDGDEEDTSPARARDREVLDHYNRAPAAPAGHTELKPLRLKAVEFAANGGLPQCAERPDCRARVTALGVDAVSRTVDLVIVAGDSSAISAAIDAARRGMRVLVVTGSTRVPLIRRLRLALRAAGTRVRRGVTVFTNAEVVCVDGLHGVEAVILRRLGTGRLIGVNASEIHVFGAANAASSVGTEKRDPSVIE
jgi:hypothetical protein